MADDDATITTPETPPGMGSQAGSPDTEASDESESVASYRRRQAGAEAARQEAVRRAEAAERERDDLRRQVAERANAGKSESDVMAERLAAAERRAEEAEQRANERVLNARFPAARGKFPEVIDEVKLAELEALLAEDDGGAAPPTPRGNNGPRRSMSSAPEEKTSAQMFEDLKRRGLPWESAETIG